MLTIIRKELMGVQTQIFVRKKVVKKLITILKIYLA